MYSNRRVRSSDADPGNGSTAWQPSQPVERIPLPTQEHLLIDCAARERLAGVATTRTTPPRASSPLIRLRRSWN